MFKIAAIALALVTPVSLDTRSIPKEGGIRRIESPAQARQRLILADLALECMVEKILADPAYRSNLNATELSELALAAMEPCERELVRMMQAYQRSMGQEGAYKFYDAFLDLIGPTVKKRARSRAGP